MSASAHVLRRGDDRHAGPDLRPAPARSARGSQPVESTDHPLRRRAACRRADARRTRRDGSACRGRRARRASTPARAERAFGRRPEVEHAGRCVRSSSKRSRHLGADLVAARPDRRADDRGRRLPPRAQRTAASTTPPASPRQPAWTTASAGGPLGAAIAIGTQSAASGERSAARARPSRARRPALADPGARAVARRAVCCWRLTASRRGSRPSARARDPPVLGDRAGVVAAARRGSARRYGARAHTASRVVNATT